MSRASTLASGARVGPYEVLALLGEGGMGQVYRARDERLSRDVALKVVHPDLAQDVERLRRFEHEAKAAGALNHPNIVAVYDTGQSNGSPYIVSELLQGETLRARMATGGLPARKAVEYGVQIARGLAAAHDKGIVHRDLKPENLFLTKDGLVKILDFGIAKLGRVGEEKAGTDVETLAQTGTNPGTMLGTVGYMSPEQVRGGATDHGSDVFSFGAVLFEMLTGQRAFKGTTAADTLSAVLREDPTETLGTKVNVPAGLLRVVRRCLEKAPEDRFQSARDLAFALEGATVEPGTSVGGARVAPARSRRLATLVAAALFATALAGLWLGRRLAPTSGPPSFQRLTFRVGRIESAQFAPDGETIVFAAEWGTSPTALFMTRAASTQSRPLGLQDAAILSISAREEMAIQIRPKLVAFAAYEGTLARAPLAGGTPREVLEGVLGADWSPDGSQLAVAHVVGDRYRVEYPIGNVLYEAEPPAWVSDVRVSRDGNRVAFVEHPLAGDQRGFVSLVGPKTPRLKLTSDYAAVDHVIWSPSGAEVWFTAAHAGSPQQIHAVALGGRERILVEVSGTISLRDVSRHGQALLTAATAWSEIHAHARGTSSEVELPAAELSFLSDLSDDGRLVLGTDVGQGAGLNFAFYMQRTDGQPPVWLGEGDGQALSPDGRFALALLLHSQPQQLVVAPTGAGETRTLEPGDVVRYSRAAWDPSGRRVVFAGANAQDDERLYVQDLAEGPPRSFTQSGVTLAKIGRPVSPDGLKVIALDPDGVPTLYPLAGGAAFAVQGLGESDLPLCWTPDGHELLVAHYEDEDAPRIEYVAVASGKARPWPGVRRLQPSSQWGQMRLLLSPDGESYAYGQMRRMSDLYLSSPLR